MKTKIIARSNVSFLLDLKTLQIFHPSNDNPVLCKICKAPYKLLYLDFVGFDLYPASMYLATLQCTSNPDHKRYMLIYKSIAEPLLLQIKSTLKKRDLTFTSNHDLIFNSHNIPFTFIRDNPDLFQPPSKFDPLTTPSYTPLIFRYRFKSNLTIKEIVERYNSTIQHHASIHNKIARIQKKKGTRKKKRR